MALGLDGKQGQIHAEAISSALAQHLPRPEAQAVVKALCKEAAAGGTHLLTLPWQRFPDRDWAGLLAFDALGQAPTEARDFAKAARALTSQERVSVSRLPLAGC